MKTAAPIKDLSELTNWKPDIELLEHLVPLLDRQILIDDYGRRYEISQALPKIVYCHDMAGGYLEADREFGMTNVFPAFRFTRWHLIDIFIYFSHHFITLPPLTWINLAHRQGVRVYGTFIFESFDNKFKSIFVENKREAMNYVELAYQLERVRRSSGFEGWLMNFEVDIPKDIAAEVVARILNFLTLLKSLGSEVIWYDSVTRSGKLSYQNALTEANEPFLRTGIDGIFINYNWNDKLLWHSQDRSRSAIDSAQIFVGVDCFGRGCPGGGGFGTPTAVNMILNAVKRRPDRPLSVALFAPGWPFEKCDLSKADGDQCKTYSLISEWDDRFWAPLSDLLPLIRGQAAGCYALYRPTVPTLPALSISDGHVHIAQDGLILATACSTGQGLFLSTGRPGSCMCMQQLMPTCRNADFKQGIRGGTDLSTAKAFQVLFHVCSGPISPSESYLLLRRVPSPHQSDDPRFVELFCFPPETRISYHCVAQLIVSLGTCSTSPVQMQQDAPICEVLRVFGLALFIDLINPVHENQSQSKTLCNAVCYRYTIKFKEAHPVVTNGDRRWTSLKFPMFESVPAGESHNARSLSLHRIGLVWFETKHNSELLLGSIKLFDSSWSV